jgi:hypothetical protein
VDSLYLTSIQMLYCSTLNNSYSLLDHYPVALLKFSLGFFILPRWKVYTTQQKRLHELEVSFLKTCCLQIQISFVALKQHAYNLTRDQSKKPGVSTKLSNSVESLRAGPKHKNWTVRAKSKGLAHRLECWQLFSITRWHFGPALRPSTAVRTNKPNPRSWRVRVNWAIDCNLYISQK